MIEPMSVTVVVMISSPTSSCRAATAEWIAALPEVTATQCLMPTFAAYSCSNWSTILPP